MIASSNLVNARMPIRLFRFPLEMRTINNEEVLIDMCRDANASFLIQGSAHPRPFMAKVTRRSSVNIMGPWV